LLPRISDRVVDGTVDFRHQPRVGGSAPKNLHDLGPWHAHPASGNRADLGHRFPAHCHSEVLASLHRGQDAADVITEIPLWDIAWLRAVSLPTFHNLCHLLRV
jgi:hypothetical protein